MVTGLAARAVFTAVFALAGLWAVWPWRGRRGRFSRSGAFCAAMCAAMLVMTWWAEPAVAARVQAAAFGCAALWFGLAAVAGPGAGRLPALLHGMMAGAMVWMLTALPTGTAMPAGPGMRAMAGGGAMIDGVASAPVLAVSVLLAVCCAATGLWWLARAVGPGPRVKDSVSIGHAAMSAGMAAMLLVML